MLPQHPVKGQSHYVKRTCASQGRRWGLMVRPSNASMSGTLPTDLAKDEDACSIVCAPSDWPTMTMCALNAFSRTPLTLQVTALT
eukprot:UN2131